MINRQSVFDAVSKTAYNGHGVMKMDHPVSGLLIDLATSVLNTGMTDREYMWLATQCLVMSFAHPNDPTHDVRIVPDHEHAS